MVNQTKNRNIEQEGAELLHAFNLVLKDAMLEQQLAERSDMPFIFLVGLPRSGTTLASQILLTSLPLGYISNFVAKFWEAPALGLHLARQILGSSRPLSFSSTMGVTPGPADPHEFGYFWKKWFATNRQDKATIATDWDMLRRTLFRMAAIAEKPMLFKTLLASHYIEELAEHLPGVVFVHIHRDILDNALSILDVRNRSLRMGQEWPFTAESGPCSPSIEAQIASYCKHYVNGMQSSLAAVAKCDTARVIEVGYEALCAEPDGGTRSLADALEQMGHPMAPLPLGRNFEPQRMEESSALGKMRTALEDVGLYGA